MNRLSSSPPTIEREFAMKLITGLMLIVTLLVIGDSVRAAETAWTCSAASGSWSATETWEGRKVPEVGALVHVRPGHVVVYDVKTETPIRAVYVAGTLTFSADREAAVAVGEDGLRTSRRRFARSLQQYFVFESDGLSVGHAAARLVVQEHRL